jgi:YidC/Oxa1 family membrane protein insertase
MDNRRLLLAVVLTIAVVVITNLLFPPAPPPTGEQAGDTVADTAAAVAPGETATAAAEGGEPPLPDTSPEDEAPEPAEETAEPPEEAAFLADDEDQVPEGETVVVETPLYRLEFSTRGAALTGARLPRYASYREDDDEGRPVELVREDDRVLGYRVAVGGDTLDLRDRIFQASRTRISLDSASGPDTLTFSYRLPDTAFRFEVDYVVRPDAYALGIHGRVRGLGDRGHSLLVDLGRGLRSNEKDQDDDLGQLEYVANSRAEGIQRKKLSDVEEGQTLAAEDAPFRWVGVRNKYFLAALLRPGEGLGFGGLLARGLPADHEAHLTASLPVEAGTETVDLTAYLGPQEYDRLAALGEGLEGVNPYGYEWLQPVIRPLVSVIMVILTWLHTNLNMAYGWVLILFGVMMRVVLFPLYQKSMRAQMAQMQVQPLMKEMQEKYEDEPEKLQKEMVKLYKEHDINPLAGCLPMLLPFPILITLFFVFQNTIEFRGVPFLYLPDLSQADPYYILPVLMGASMFLLQWIGQRGMERNTQMKFMSYGFPVIFTIIFLQFPAGLNLYYATSNLASLPQQWYLSKERMKMKEEGGVPSLDDG